MNTLELNEFGIQEMNLNEVEEVNGGSTGSVILAFAGFLAACATGGAVPGVIAITSLIVTCVEHAKG
jgi:hypothetical protein